MYGHLTCVLVLLQVGTGHGHHYQRWRATLLPITAPLTLFVAAPGLLPSVGQAGMAYSLLCAAVGCALIYSTYPSSNVPRKTLKGAWASLLDVFTHAIVSCTSCSPSSMCGTC